MNDPISHFKLLDFIYIPHMLTPPNPCVNKIHKIPNSFQVLTKNKKNWYDIFGIILSCSMGSSICPFLRAALLGKQCAASKLMRRNLCQDCPSGRSRIGTYINSCILCLIHTMIVSTTCTTSMTQTYITTGQINFKKTMHACIPCMHAFQPSQHTYWVRIYICVLNWNENCILHLSYE